MSTPPGRLPFVRVLRAAFAVGLACAFAPAGLAAPKMSLARKLAPSVPCGFLFTNAKRLRPSKLEWTKRIDSVFPLVDQGAAGACWTIQGAESLTVAFRRVGLLGPEEKLSYEFYYHAQLMSLIDPEMGYTIRKFPDVDEFLNEGGGFVADHFDLIKKHGIVTEAQYKSVSKLVGGTRLGSDAYYRRISAAIPRIRKARTWAEARAIFSEYVGDLDAFPKTTKEIRAKLRKMEVLHIARDAKKRGKPPFVQTAELLLAGVKASIDDGVPVSIGIDVDWRVFDKIDRRQSSSRFRYGNSHQFAHSMLVLGYKLDARGEVEHLLVRNSWGPAWGEAGLVTLDRKFLEYYLADVEQVESVEGFRQVYDRFMRLPAE